MKERGEDCEWFGTVDRKGEESVGSAGNGRRFNGLGCLGPERLSLLISSAPFLVLSRLLSAGFSSFGRVS